MFSEENASRLAIATALDLHAMEPSVDPISVCVNECYDADDNRCAGIKIQDGTAYEVNIMVPIDDLSRLAQVRNARWDERGSVAIGTSAGGRAFWSSDKDGFSILIGQDDESWDISIRLPLGKFEEIIRESTPLQN